MDVREIETSLRGRIGTKVVYLGVFTSDKLPYNKISNKPTVFIANTLKSSANIHTVGHWVCFYMEFHPFQRLIFFDSFGFPPRMYCEGFRKFLSYHNAFSIYDYGRQLQPTTSVKCGLYAVFFIHFISHYGIDRFSWTLKHIFSKKDLQSNDRYTSLYYFKYLSRPVGCKKWKHGSKRAITYQECRRLNRMNYNDDDDG